jgi:hypothetical protein
LIVVELFGDMSVWVTDLRTSECVCEGNLRWVCEDGKDLMHADLGSVELSEEREVLEKEGHVDVGLFPEEMTLVSRGGVVVVIEVGVVALHVGGSWVYLESGSGSRC